MRAKIIAKIKRRLFMIFKIIGTIILFVFIRKKLIKFSVKKIEKIMKL
jgi:hypothetical protein